MMMLPEPPSLLPLSRNDLLPLFIKKLFLAAASHAMLKNKADIAPSIASYLRQAKIADLPKYDPKAAALLARAPDPLTHNDNVRVTKAVAGIAETGTIVFIADDVNPNASHFLPDVEITILFVSEICATLEEVLAIVWPMPRGLYCVTGPSRSADIEQTLLMGAYGPRSLHVLVIEDET